MRGVYRYYLTMRPFEPGSIPSNVKVVNSEVFPERRFVPAINHNAYAWFETQTALDPKDVSNYELAEVYIP